MKKIDSENLNSFNGGRPRWLSGALCLAALIGMGVSVASVAGIYGAVALAPAYVTFCNDWLNG